MLLPWLNERSGNCVEALASEDAEGKVWLGYNSPEYMKRHHDLKDQFMKNIAAIGTLVNEALK